MVDLLIKLLEKLAELAKHRKEVEDKPFDLLISPLYSKLETIHRDYLRLFESCLCELNSGEKLEIVIKHLAVDRIEQETLRRSVIQFAESYGDNPRLNLYKEFFSKVGNYFQCADITNCSHTLSCVLLRDMRTLMSEKDDLKGSNPITKRHDLTILTQRVLLHIRDLWKEISKEYAKLNVQRATG